MPRKLKDVIDNYSKYYPKVKYDIISDSFSINLIEAGVLDENGLPQIGIRPYDDQRDIVFFPVAQLIPNQENEHLKLLWGSASYVGLTKNNSGDMILDGIPLGFMFAINTATKQISIKKYDKEFAEDIIIDAIDAGPYKMYAYFKKVEKNISKEKLEELIIKMNDLVDTVELISQTAFRILTNR